MVFFENIFESGKLLKHNWRLLVPSFLGMLMAIGFALIFIVMNDLISLISTDPSSLFIAGGISAMVKKVSSVFINQTQIIKIVLSLIGFIMANFMAGSSLIGMKYIMIKDFDITLVENVEIEGVDMRDYPDFCDAFISGADYDGVAMTEEQIIQMEEDYPDWKYEQVENSLY